MIAKKGETETYSFLIGLIITFLMLTTVGCIAYNMYAKSSETKDSFNNLVDIIKNMKDGEQGKIPFYIDEDHIIVGFRSDDTKVKSDAVVGADLLLSYCYNWFTGGYDGLMIERPEKCKGKGCICLCEYKKDMPKSLGTYEWIRDAAVFVTSDVCSGTEDICVTDDKMGQYNFIGQKACEIAFIPGVKGRYWMGIEPLRKFTAIDKRGVAPLFYMRIGDTIVLDDEQPTKAEIEKEIIKPSVEKINTKLPGYLGKEKTIYFLPVNWGKTKEDFERAAESHYAYTKQKVEDVDTDINQKTTLLKSFLDGFNIIKVDYMDCKGVDLKASMLQIKDKLTECLNKYDSKLDANSMKGSIIIGITDEANGDTAGISSLILDVAISDYRSPSTTAHEFGHLMMFCDEYGYKQWKQSDELIKSVVTNQAGYSYSCINPYPKCCRDNPIWEKSGTTSTGEESYKNYIESKNIGYNCYAPYDDLAKGKYKEKFTAEYPNKESYETMLKPKSCAGHICTPKTAKYCRGIMDADYDKGLMDDLFEGSLELSYLDKDMPEDYA